MQTFFQGQVVNKIKLCIWMAEWWLLIGSEGPKSFRLILKFLKIYRAFLSMAAARYSDHKSVTETKFVQHVAPLCIIITVAVMCFKLRDFPAPFPAQWAQLREHEQCCCGAALQRRDILKVELSEWCMHCRHAWWTMCDIDVAAYYQISGHEHSHPLSAV